MDGEIQLGVKLTPTDIKKTATQLQQEITKIFDNSAGKQTSKQFRQMEVQLDRLNNRSNKLQESLRRLETTKIPTQEYKEISKQIEEAQKKLNAYRAAEEKAAEIGKPLKGDRLRSMQYEVAQLENTIEYAKGELQELVETGKAFTMGSDTQAYKNTANDLNNVNNQIVQTISATEQLAQSEEQLPEPIKRTSKAVEVMKGTMSKVLLVIEKIFVGFEKIVRAVGGKLASAAKKALSHFTKLGESTDKHQLSIKKLAKTMLKYGLGIRSVFLLWRKLRTYTTEALKSMATQFSDVNADVSMLMNSFNQMKNSFGTMAQPLLHALAPALTYIINLITSAMTALANFFAILTGQKFIYKATKQNKDYAGSVGDVGGAAKEANEELSEYDNLIVIQQDKSGGGGGGGGAADAAAGMWEKVDAESDFAKQLKEAIKNQDWEGVGGILANKLNIITKKFDDWIQNKFRPTAKKWASNIARILNGLVDGWDSGLFGRTIGHGLMAIADVIATFFETFKWKNLGKKVAGAINGLFTAWEPDTVARLFAGKFNSVIEFVAGLIDKEKGINFKLIGSKLGQTLKRTIERINWKQLGADLSGLATGILEGLASFIKESEVGVTVGNAINEFLSGINFGELAKDLSDLATNILNAVADCLETLEWPAVGQAIADFLKNINWIDFITTLLKVALNLIKGLGEALIQIATDPKALLSIAEGLMAIFGAKWIWSKITGLFATNLATSIAEGSAAAGTAGTAASNVFTAVKNGLGASATAGVSSLGLTGISGVAYSAGGALASVLGAKTGAQLGAEGGALLSHWLGAPQDLVDEYLKEAEDPFGYFVENIGDIFAGAGEVVKDSVVGIFDAAYLTGTYPIRIGGQIGAGIGGAIVTALGDYDLADEYAKEAQNPFAYWAENAGDIAAGFGEVIKDAAVDTWDMLQEFGDDVVGLVFEDPMDKYYRSSEHKKAQKQLEASQEAYVNMLEKRYKEGKKINDFDKQMLIDLGRISDDSKKKFESDSNHYADIAKKQAGALTSTEKEFVDASNHYVQIAQQNAKKHVDSYKQIEDASNHHAQIAKANAGVVSDSQKAMTNASNHHASVAKANAQVHITSYKQMEQASNHHAEIAKANAGVQERLRKDAIDSSNHYVKIAQANNKKVEDSVTTMTATSGNRLAKLGTTAIDSSAVMQKAYQDATKKSQDAFSGMEGAYQGMTEGIKTSVSTIPNSFQSTFTNAYNAITGAFSATKTFFNGVADGVKAPFSTMADYFKTTFTNSWNGVTSVFKSNSPQFQTIQDSVSSTFKSAINSMIGGINNSLLSPFRTLSNAFAKMRGFSINGASPFSGLPTFNVPTIPKLAQGAVLPPNSPFLAVVGDQKSGTNVEAPLDTIVQALQIALENNNNNQPIILNLNGRQVAQAVWDEENKRYKQTGQRFRFS